MKIGFTGSREGMTHSQYSTFINVMETLVKAGFRELAHGKCIGSDMGAHAVAANLKMQIVAHPPTDKKLIGEPIGDYEYAEMDPKPYLVRNKNIVDGCYILVATPLDLKETQRSGTWSTVRYARRKKKRILIINALGNIV